MATETNDVGSSADDDMDARVNATVDAKLAKADVRTVVTEFVRENFKHRDTIRELKARIPKEGSVILDGEQAKAWSKYQEFGDPSEIRKRLAQGDESTTALNRIQADQNLDRAFGLAGLKANATGKKLAAGLDIVVEATGKDKDGEPVLESFVKGEGDKKTPLKKYAEKEWADVIGALRTESTPQGGTPLRRVFGNPPPAPAGNDTQRDYAAQQATGLYAL